MDLSGKNVVFVAGLGGIGYESCRILMTKNLAFLVILDIIENPNGIQTLQELNPGTKIIYEKFDVTDKEGIKKTLNKIVSEIKFIDVLVNGAGVLLERNVELSVAINLTGLINTTLEALPYMDKAQKGRGGVLLNISSLAGLEPSVLNTVYGATKFGIIGFTRSLAHPFYYDRTGVAVTAICPGMTETCLTTNPEISGTFDYCKPLTEKFRLACKQPASVCAEHLVKIIEKSENGSIWISNLGKMTKVEFQVHCTL